MQIVDDTGEVPDPPAVVTSNALVLDEAMSYEQWVAYGDRLSLTVEGVMWWVGDWWRFGSHRYGDRAKAAAESKRWSFQTFANAASVAGRFETSRRREVLSWSHHAEVAPLDPADADDLLDKAEANGWSRSDLRTEVKALRRRQATASILAGAPVTGAKKVEHADCLDFIASLPDASVSLLLTDPPYNVTDNEWDTFGTDEDFSRFTRGWLAALRPKMAPEFTAFIFCDADYSPSMCADLLATGWPVLRQAIWHRPNLAKKRTGSLTFLSAYEPFWHAGTRALMLPDEWGEERFDVQRYTVPQSNHVEDRSYHPTQKPLDLFRRLVTVGSGPGELVVDPFVGAGTTAVAADVEGRAWRCADADAGYVALANARLAP